MAVEEVERANTALRRQGEACGVPTLLHPTDTHPAFALRTHPDEICGSPQSCPQEQALMGSRAQGRAPGSVSYCVRLAAGAHYSRPPLALPSWAGSIFQDRNQGEEDKGLLWSG